MRKSILRDIEFQEPSLYRSLALIAVLAAPVSAGLLSASGVFVKDQGGVLRSQFSNNERLSLTARLNNATASLSRISFTFKITSPAGEQVFLHTGNSVPGSVGNSASQVSGIPISSFFKGPGVYTFAADAVLDGQTVTQSAVFTISSPNIILVYPPNGARDVADRPLTLRWSSSGAARYRVTVGDNAALFNSVFNQQTAGVENFLAYPDNPADSRARLAAGKSYFWKVEGLDAAGNVISQSEVPYNFTAQTAALTRDMAILSLEATGRTGDSVNFTVRVANQGGTNESNVPLRFSVGGIPAPGTPLPLPQMSPGESRDYPFTASLPADQAQSLAIACVEFFDDSVPNNCKSIQVTRATGPSGDTGFGPARPLTKEELWQALVQKLAQLGTNLDDYGIAGLSELLSSEDLQALLAQLSSGQAQISLSGPQVGAPPPPDEAFLPPPTPAYASGPSGPDVNAGPEVAPPTAGAQGGATGDAEVWKGLSDLFKNSGFDPGQYSLGGINPPLSSEDMAAMMDQLASGQAKMTISGPPPGLDPWDLPPPTPAYATGPAGPDVNAGPEVAPPTAEGRGGAAGDAEVWKGLSDLFKNSGFDPGQYSLGRINPPLSSEDMAAMMDQLASGQAKMSISGPPPELNPWDLPPPTPAYASGPQGPDVNAGPEVAPPAPPEAIHDLTNELGPLLKAGGLDLGQFDIGSIIPPLSAEDAAALADQLAKGEVKMTLSGPPPAPEPLTPPPPVPATPKAPAGPDVNDAPEVAPPAAAPASEVGREFAGTASTSFGEKGMTQVIRDEKTFARIWRRLSRSDPPELDFKEYMLVAMVAGNKADVGRYEVEDIAEGLTGLIVRYRAVPRDPALRLTGVAKNSGAAYMLKVVRASGLEADFQEVGQEGR